MSRLSWPERSVLPVAVPGLKFIVSAAFVTGLFFFMGWGAGAVISLALTLFICWFFRDPDRDVPDQSGCVVSPADGKVIVAQKVETSEFIDSPSMKISIFMNIFNVHVNRIPFSGSVESISYIPGKFVNASFDKASEHNERNALIIITESGQRYGVVQIAGLIARRIMCGVGTGDRVLRGSRYGMISFGSRLDIYLPLDARLAVSVGDHVRAGSSIIGFM
ncbi:MAG: phosphatidylserine decarboxylase family protein [Desulfamplus sp.]|nr:phosphatidylserine decarboxylase family protein [Desulfamplus sp.]